MLVLLRSYSLLPLTSKIAGPTTTPTRVPLLLNMLPFTIPASLSKNPPRTLRSMAGNSEGNRNSGKRILDRGLVAGYGVQVTVRDLSLGGFAEPTLIWQSAARNPARSSL